MKPQLAKPKIVIKYHKEGKKVHAILDVNRSTTVWHEIFAGSKFCDFCDFCSFSSDPQKEVPANKNYRKHFSCKTLFQS